MRTGREIQQKVPNDVIEDALAEGRLPKPQTSKLTLSDWHAAQALFQGSLKLGLSPRKRRLAKVVFEAGYLQWPHKIQALVQGRSVLDFGSGKGLHPLGYVAMGANSAVGFDPFIDPENKIVKIKATGQFVELETTMRNIEEHFGGVCFTDDLAIAHANAPYGCIVLHNVTEHLQDVPGAFAEVASLLSPNGFLVFHHHNFYSWDGHHAQPKNEDQINLTLEAHRELVDWAHIDFSPPANHPIVRSTLNRIKLDELRTAAEEKFSILLWHEIASPDGRGLGRFDKIPKSIQQRFEPRDLTVKNILAVAKLKRK